MKTKNPHFGVWIDSDDYGGIDPVRPVMEGRAVELSYKERLHYLPTYDVVMGIEFENIVYPKKKQEYETIIYLARAAREREGIKDPYDYKVPDWFNTEKRRDYITLFRYLIAKGNRDELYRGKG